MSLSLNDSTSIYQQISEIIENDIINGILLANDRAPSTNELSKAYNINPTTAARGITVLVENGILYKKRGLGMFVCEDAKDKILQKRKMRFKEEFISKFLLEARQLGISKDELLTIIERHMEG